MGGSLAQLTRQGLACSHETEQRGPQSTGTWRGGDGKPACSREDGRDAGGEGQPQLCGCLEDPWGQQVCEPGREALVAQAAFPTSVHIS